MWPWPIIIHHQENMERSEQEFGAWDMDIDLPLVVSVGISQTHEMNGNAVRWIPRHSTSITKIVIFGQQKHSTARSTGRLSIKNIAFVILQILNTLNGFTILYFYFSNKS